jgi:UDP-N-acetylmuramate dehydrogenase
MLPPDFVESLTRLFGDRARFQAPLAPFTTFRVGGPAECLVEVRTSDELVEAVRMAVGAGVRVTPLGGGSNSVISDRGLPGLVLRMHGGCVREEPDGAPSAGHASPDDAALVRADAGVTMNALVRWTIARGFAGVEAFAGTPGTVGGAVFGNAHYAGRHIGDLVATVRFLTPGSGAVAEWPRSLLAFGYDYSRFHDTDDLILSAVFSLEPGADPAALRETARASLSHRKRTQPLSAPSAGCIFQNPDPALDRLPADVPYSAGALIDRAGLKGHAVGGASISTTHANFIVSDGTATAADIRALVRRCKAEVLRRFGVELREEVRWVGEFEA